VRNEAITVVPYDPEWPRRFESERVLLEGVLEPWLDGGIHHIGSTAVPGLASKPIIDMMAGVRDFEEARAAYDVLAEHSYVHEPHRPGIAHRFGKHLPDLTYGLHLTEPGSDLWRERLAFRDALLADAELVREYEALKLGLADSAGSAQDYTAGKREFVGRVLASAGLTFGRR
jgi:GrpB-like predicted nucleotidyltransferase (UPF0157 family)